MSISDLGSELAKVHSAFYYRKGDRFVLEAQLPHPDAISTYGWGTKDRMNALQRDGDHVAEEVRQNKKKFDFGQASLLATQDYPVRFAAGGAVYLVDSKAEGKYLAFVEKTGSKPRLSAMAGHSITLDEIVDPNTLIAREAIEEGLVVVNGVAYLPRRGNSRELHKDDVELAKGLLLTIGVEPSEYRHLNGDEALKARLNMDDVTLFYEGSQNVSVPQVNVMWDPTKAGFDFIRIEVVQVDELSDLRIYDFEQAGGVPLKRKHVLVPFGHQRKAVELISHGDRPSRVLVNPNELVYGTTAVDLFRKLNRGGNVTIRESIWNTLFP
jgi:hypothetical protein